jgi:hypothetical protein
MSAKFLKQASMILVVAATTILPNASFAASKGMNSCVEAFKELLPEGHPVRVVTREQFQVPYTSLRKPETISLKATGAKTGESFGSAQCVVDRKGQLLAMQVTDTSIRLAKTNRNEVTGG